MDTQYTSIFGMIFKLKAVNYMEIFLFIEKCSE